MPSTRHPHAAHTHNGARKQKAVGWLRSIHGKRRRNLIPLRHYRPTRKYVTSMTLTLCLRDGSTEPCVGEGNRSEPRMMSHYSLRLSGTAEPASRENCRKSPHRVRHIKSTLDLLAMWCNRRNDLQRNSAVSALCVRPLSLT